MIGQELGKIVKELRKKRSLTQEQLSEYSQLNIKYIQRVEYGQREPSISNFIKLAKGLNIPAAELLMLLEKEIESSSH